MTLATCSWCGALVEMSDEYANEPPPWHPPPKWYKPCRGCAPQANAAEKKQRAEGSAIARSAGERFHRVAGLAGGIE